MSAGASAGASLSSIQQRANNGDFNNLPFWYIFYPGGVPGSFSLTALQQNVGASFVVDNDNDFLWDRIVSSATGLYSVYLVDNFTKRPLTPSQGAPVNIENLGGVAAVPFWLPMPYLIRRTSSVQGFFNDRSGAGNTIQLAFIGMKVGKILE